MKALSKREQLLIGAAVVVAVAVGVPGLLSGPASGAGGPLPEAERKHNAVMADLVRTRGEMNGMQDQIDRHVSTGTPRDLVERMLGEAQAAAKTAGLTLTDLKPDQPESIAGLRRVPVQITLSAAFPRVVRFLYELEQKNPRVRVDSLRIVSGDTRSERLDLELRLVSYVKGEEGAHAAGS
jgi:Tfp pilus assembly protein PilO